MAANQIDLLTKRCHDCGTVKPASDFYLQRYKSGNRGLRSICKLCENTRVMTRRAARRAEMGEAAFRAHQNLISQRSRARTGNAWGIQYDRDKRRARQALINLHRDEYDHLLLLARRGEL